MGKLGRDRREEKELLKQEGQQNQGVEMSPQATRRLGRYMGKFVDLGGLGWMTMEEPGDKGPPKPHLSLSPRTAWAASMCE